MIDLYLTSTLLFAALAATDSKSYLSKNALFSALLLLTATAGRIGYSDFSLIKAAFICYALSLPLDYRYEKKHEAMAAGYNILVFIVALYVLYTGALRSEVISAALTGVGILVTAFELLAYRGKERIERAESNVIFLCGAVVATVSTSYHNQYFGIAILCIHLLIKIVFRMKANRLVREEMIGRLEALEQRFSKQVEHEARKISKGMEGMVEEIEEKSMRDPLTKVLNRAMIEKRVGQLLEDSNNRFFSIALIDLDDFKKINDTLGHVTGDKCLLNLTEFFMKNKRRSDFIGRFGGDEFILVMPNIGAKDAVKIMDYHRKAIDDRSNPHITITVGIATYPHDGETLQALIESADKSLYLAKSRGKNAVAYTGNLS